MSTQRTFSETDADSDVARADDLILRTERIEAEKRRRARERQQHKHMTEAKKRAQRREQWTALILFGVIITIGIVLTLIGGVTH